MGKELPKGWIKVELQEIVADKYYPIGDGDHGKIKPKHYLTTGIPYIRVGDMGWGEFFEKKLVYISEETHNENLKSELVPGDILIAKTGATIGKCCIVPDHIKRANTTSSVGKVTIHEKVTSPKWILYNFLSKEFYNMIWQHSHRTAQPGFNNKDLKIFKVYLPPLPEQKRIVTKLDNLFGHLDQLKARLETIPQLLKNFRQSVLTQAVTGKLTDSKVNWKEEILSNLTTKVGSGATPKGGQASYKKDGIPLVRSMNIHFNGIKYDGIAYIDEFQADALKNVEIKPDDVLLNITGASIGRVCVAEDKVIGGRVNQHVSILRTNDDILSQYLNLYLASPIMQDSIFEQNYGVTRQALTKTQILNFKIPLPSIEEQKQIVKRVESLFAKADGIEEKYNNLKEKIDQFPQAIFAKAFKGELVEQLPTDGDAGELLEEIRDLKNNKN